MVQYRRLRNSSTTNDFSTKVGKTYTEFIKDSLSTSDAIDRN
jgi:hypothetical protein